MSIGGFEPNIMQENQLETQDGMYNAGHEGLQFYDPADVDNNNINERYETGTTRPLNHLVKFEDPAAPTEQPTQKETLDDLQLVASRLKVITPASEDRNVEIKFPPGVAYTFYSNGAKIAYRNNTPYMQKIVIGMPKPEKIGLFENMLDDFKHRTQEYSVKFQSEDGSYTFAEVEQKKGEKLKASEAISVTHLSLDQRRMITYCLLSLGYINALSPDGSVTQAGLGRDSSVGLASRLVFIACNLLDCGDFTGEAGIHSRHYGKEKPEPAYQLPWDIEKGQLHPFSKPIDNYEHKGKNTGSPILFTPLYPRGRNLAYDDSSIRNSTAVDPTMRTQPQPRRPHEV